MMVLGFAPAVRIPSGAFRETCFLSILARQAEIRGAANPGTLYAIESFEISNYQVYLSSGAVEVGDITCPRQK